MSVTIDNEVKQLIRSPLDISKMSDRYKTSNGIYSFPSPTLTTIEKNLYFLLRNSRTETFKGEYKFKPDYLSYDEYGTVILDQLLMYINNIKTVEEFNLQTVVIPTFDAIVSILSDDFPEKEPSEMIAIDW
jgi:hypothetical protein